MMMMPPSARCAVTASSVPGVVQSPTFYYIRTAAEQRAFDDVADHFARNTGVAAHDDFEPFPGCGFGDETHVGGGEFNDIERSEFSVAGPPIVPRMPEMDLMRVMSQISLFL